MSIELHNAILANSAKMVKSYLKNGIDLNKSPIISTLNEELETRYSDRLKTEEIWVVRSSSDNWSITPLHVAVINCYHNHGRISGWCEKKENALGIIKSLVNKGAKTDEKTLNIHLCNLYHHTKEWVSPGPVTPVELALFLKKYANGVYGTEQAAILDEVINIIHTAATESGNINLPRVSVPESVMATLNRLMSSEKFSDVYFTCEDGTKLCAHKNILAAASPYFSRYFEGPWGREQQEKHANGEWKTSNPPEIMRAILSFIYTGKIDKSLLESEPKTMLSISTEYELQGLMTLSEASCIRQLSMANVKDTLQCAHLHNSAKLKRSCFQFIRSNSTEAMFNPAIMSLQTEDPELWEEMKAAITPAKKRRRVA